MLTMVHSNVQLRWLLGMRTVLRACLRCSPPCMALPWGGGPVSADRTPRLRACMQQQECFGMRGSVKEDVAKLRASPLINKDIEIYGFVYDVKARPTPNLASDLALTHRPQTSICRQGALLLVAHQWPCLSLCAQQLRVLVCRTLR